MFLDQSSQKYSIWCILPKTIKLRRPQNHVKYPFNARKAVWLHEQVRNKSAVSLDVAVERWCRSLER